ncbi:MAG: hypothetical protein U1F43_36790 [Myxococcota bacterium]
MHHSDRLILSLSATLALAACASGGDGAKCAFIKTEGLCKAEVSLDPREADSPDEATTLEVRWQWLGSDAGAEVAPRTVQYHMTAQEAAWRREAWETLGKSRCTIEEPVAPCQATRRIVFVEAEP